MWIAVIAAGNAHQNFLDFVCHEQFGRIDPRVLGDQVLICWETLNPGNPGGEFVIQHQLVCGETQGSPLHQALP